MTPFFSGLYTTIWITQCFFGLENFVVSRRFDWKHQTEFEDVLISIHMGLKLNFEQNFHMTIPNKEHVDQMVIHSQTFLSLDLKLSQGHL